MNFLLTKKCHSKQPTCILAGEAGEPGRPDGPVELPAEARAAHGQVRAAAEADTERVPGERAAGARRPHGEYTAGTTSFRAGTPT